MENLSDRITLSDELCNGKPTIRGMRISVQTILEYLSAGDTPEEILKQYPLLEPEDISACLQFASDLMKRGFIIKPVA